MKTNIRSAIKNVFISFIIVFLPIILIELILVGIYGPIPSEPIPELFHYEHLAIYDPLFKTEEHKGREYYIPARKMNSAKPFPVDKNPDKTRIFLTGGSFVEDWNALKLEENLNRILKDIVTNKSCEIINCGMAVYDSYRVSLIIKEIINYEPDIVIVLTGNNENIYDKNVNITLFNMNRFLRKFRIYRKAQDILLQKRRKKDVTLNLDQENIDLAEKLRIYKENINQIIQLAKSKNIPLILGSLPINLNGIPPAGKRPVNKLFLKGCLLLENGSINEAVQAFNQHIDNNRLDPFGYYYLGSAYEEKGEYEKALSNYYNAVKYDKAVRVNPEMNQYLQTISKEKKVNFIDIEKTFYQIAENRITGFTQFRDNCHIWPEYYEYLNNLVFKEMINNKVMFKELFDLRQAGISPLDTINIPEKQAYYHPIPIIRAVWEIIANKEYGLCEYSVKLFKSAYSLDTSCFNSIHLFKERIKNILEKDFYLKHVMQDDTLFEGQWPMVLYHIGEMYRREKMYDKAVNFFDSSISQNNQNYLPYLGKALAFYSQDRKEEMVENLKKADKLTENREIQIYKELLFENTK